MQEIVAEHDELTDAESKLDPKPEGSKQHARTAEKPPVVSSVETKQNLPSEESSKRLTDFPRPKMKVKVPFSRMFHHMKGKSASATIINNNIT